MSRSKTSQRWLQEHGSDEHVRRARQEGYRSRAVYKLLEIDRRDRILRPGLTVIDLGAAPGGWSQLASHAVGPRGRVIAVDCLPMEFLAHVSFVQGDFREPEVLDNLLNMLGERKTDLVLSDMSPNISGVTSVDQPRAIQLAELALELARRVLSPGGDMLVKVFQGEGFDAYHRELRDSFRQVRTRKPKASRPRSREMYLLARGYDL